MNKQYFTATTRIILPRSRRSCRSQRVIYSKTSPRGISTASFWTAATSETHANTHQRTARLGKAISALAIESKTTNINPKSSSLLIPPHAAHKVCTPSDAVSLISRGDTIAVSGFVAQGSPDLILKAIADRYKQECIDGTKHGLGNLTLLFGGGPGDWESRGLNYLAILPEMKAGDSARPMVKRAIGAHYGQVPMLGELAVNNKLEAWTLPLGSISRMIRAQATHSPGHITTIGLGTSTDPTPGVGNGGAANELALQSPLHKELVTKLAICYDGNMNSDFLMYKALPIQVGIVRATTADSSGNLSGEHESLLCDQLSIAMAARNSGGVVIAQVKRLCQVGSLPSRNVLVPGAMVDCVVVVDDEDHEKFHPMSYVTRNSSDITGEIRSPVEDLPKMILDERKVIARRASMALKPGETVNLGIGLPEGVANIAGEEGMLPFITLTTEPGTFGGLPASGREFGPSHNADALIAMNQQFDFYDGGGLDIAFLGAAEVSKTGDVNVSRMSKERLTGPGGFIDISQSTGSICFMCTFTAKGLEVSFDSDEDDNGGSISIVKDGKVKKFVNQVYEITFSGAEAVRRGQKVYYITERCVFRKTAAHDVLELIEIAPGVDLEKDVLGQMEFVPVISQDVQIMDRRFFRDEKMNVDLLGSLTERCTYHDDDHLLFIDLFGVSLQNSEDIDWFSRSLDHILQPITKIKGPVDIIASYDGFDLRSGLEESYANALKELEQRHYKSVKRYSGSAFRQSLLRKKSSIEPWNANIMFRSFDENSNGVVSPEELLRGVRKSFGLRLKQGELDALCKEEITLRNFSEVITKCLSDFGTK